MNFSEIYEGWKNHTFPDKDMKALILEVSQERLSKCITCPFNTTPGKINFISRCDACGCLLKPKSKCLSCRCGIEHYNAQHPDDPKLLMWDAVLTEEQNDDIHTTIKVDEN